MKQRFTSALPPEYLQEASDEHEDSKGYGVGREAGDHAADDGYQHRVQHDRSSPPRVC